MFDAGIVGGGPIGLFLARQLQNRGVRAKVYEEHATIGKPEKYTGVLSKNVLEFMDLPESCILNKVRGARLHAPNGQCVTVKRKETQAYIIDTAILDQELAEGVEIEKKRVKTLDEVDAKIIVGADGPKSTVAQQAGFAPIQKHVIGYEYEIKNETHDQEYVELYFGSDVAPNFFAWIVPTDERLRVGLATPTHPMPYLQKFFDSKFKGAEILAQKGGLIPLAWRSSFVRDSIALLGDAAGHVKPTTGGGIYMGFQSAELLADAIEQNDLQWYETTWHQLVKPELEKGGRLRSIFNKLTDEELNTCWNVLGQTEVIELVEEYGDMDKPSMLLKAVMQKPSLLRLAPYLRHAL